MNKKLPTLFTLLLLSISAIADDFKDGKEAYEREDYRMHMHNTVLVRCIAKD